MKIKCGLLASTILISSCAMVKITALGGSIILKPQIQAGSYATKTVVNPYPQASINHLILKLYTYDGTEHDTGIQKSIPNAQLTNSIAFSNLRVNMTYRIKALAYASSDESNQISTNDANSYTEVTLTNDDHPAIAALKVKLIDIAFNGQGTGSLQVTNGGYNYAASEGITIPCIVGTFAGGTAQGYTDGVGTAAKLNKPIGVGVDSAGNVYVGDKNNNLIRKISSSGVVSTLAGGGGTTTAGYQNGTGTAAKFNYPFGVAADSSGNVYVADYGNNLIRKITAGGIVTTLAGGAGATTQGYADGTGTAAKFYGPYGIAVDGAGNVYVGERYTNVIRKITSDGIVSTFAGGGGGTIAGFLDGVGTAARFYNPYGVAVDNAGNVYIADHGNHLIRKITSSGVVTTLAGGGGGTIAGYVDGQGTSAQFYYAEGIAVDVYGNLYIGDSANNLIRKITSAGMVSTLAGGAGTIATGSLDGIGTSATFNDPTGMAVDWAGHIYVADYNNNLIRVLK